MITTHPTEVSCAEAADKARRENPTVITYCVRTQPDAQKTTKLGVPLTPDARLGGTVRILRPRGELVTGVRSL